MTVVARELLTRFGDGAVAGCMTGFGYIAHGAQPLEGFRGGSAFRAVVVVVVGGAAVADAIVVAG